MNQMGAIREYAESNNIEIVRVYIDEGKSGLTAKGLDGLNCLIRDVESTQSDFSVILVYDVSRWGRFQEFDESVKIERLCRRAGITIHYCAEKFVNDSNLGASVVKFLKRLMAAEYKREIDNRRKAVQPVKMRRIKSRKTKPASRDF